MNVVADTGSIDRVIIISENVQNGTSTDGNLWNERHQIVRDSSRIFTDQATGVCPYRIEVTEIYHGYWAEYHW